MWQLGFGLSLSLDCVLTHKHTSPEAGTSSGVRGIITGLVYLHLNPAERGIPSQISHTLSQTIHSEWATRKQHVVLYKSTVRNNDFPIELVNCQSEAGERLRHGRELRDGVRPSQCLPFFHIQVPQSRYLKRVNPAFRPLAGQERPFTQERRSACVLGMFLSLYT